jgi:hypothetical protein
MLAFLALLLTAQAQDNLTNGLVGYWPFDEGAGSLIADQSGKGNNGTLLRGVPSTMWTQGHIGTALYFDGESAAYVRVPSSQSLQKFTNITFAAWVRCDDTEREAPIIAKEQGEGRSYWFGTCPSAVFGIWLGWTGQWVIGDRDNGFIIGGQWTHLVSVWDGVSLKHYQDGNYVAGGASFSGPIWIDDTFLAIGVNSAIDSVSFKGVIDEVRIYNRALSETEVKALYAYDGNQTNQLLRVITELVQKGAWCLSTNTQVHKVAASGTRALVTSNEWETCLLNLSDPAKPVLLGTCQPLFPPSKVELVGNLAYIASWEPAFLSTVEIFDFTSPTNPVLKGYYDTAGYAQDVKVVGSIAYVADSEAGLLILDVSNPAFPWRLGGYDTMGSVQIVQVAGHYAYIADGNWLVILDVSNPSSPRRVGVYEVAGGIQTISARGSRVYLCEGTGDLRILDVSNPASIQSLGTYRGWGNPAQAVASFEHGYRVIAKMTPDDDFRGLFIARSAEAPTSPKALAGQSICFTSATALAGTLQPLMWLHDQGVDVKTLKIRYVGSQFSSILNAWSGEFAACGSTSRFFRTWLRNNPDKAKDIKELWRTPPLPHNAVVVRDDIPAEIAVKVAKALADLDKDTAVDQSQFRIDQQHFELANNSAYKPVIDFLRRYDAAIGLPAQIKLPKGR